MLPPSFLSELSARLPLARWFQDGFGFSAALVERVDLGQLGTLRANAAGVLVSVAEPVRTWVPASAAALADSGGLSAAACTLETAVFSNGHATDGVWFQLFDAAAVPADGTAPRIASVWCPALETIELRGLGLVCATGLCWASSSTPATKTITALSSGQCSAGLR